MECGTTGVDSKKCADNPKKLLGHYSQFLTILPWFSGTDSDFQFLPVLFFDQQPLASSTTVSEALKINKGIKIDIILFESQTVPMK